MSVKNKNQEMWYELFGMWLESIGAEIVPINEFSAAFYYHSLKYRFMIFNGSHRYDEDRKLDIGYRTPTRTRLFRWFRIDLKLGADIQDPSFNPDVFFEPIQKRLDKDIAFQYGR